MHKHTHTRTHAHAHAHTQSHNTLHSLPTSLSQTDLLRNEGESDADHQEHEELAEPDVWRNIPITHCGEGDDDKIYRFKHVEGALPTAALYVLNAANSVHKERQSTLSQSV